MRLTYKSWIGWLYFAVDFFMAICAIWRPKCHDLGDDPRWLGSYLNFDRYFDLHSLVDQMMLRTFFISQAIKLASLFGFLICPTAKSKI